MTTTYTLTTIQQAIEVGTTLSRSWFRGHATVCNELTPKVFRDKYAPHRRAVAGFELRIIEGFKRSAPALASTVPADDDSIGWLVLMQHHGTPTRLLDWTESLLVALFFAVSEEPTKDGELWAMYPEELNVHSCKAVWGTFLPQDPFVRYLASAPSETDKEKLVSDLKKALKEPDIPKYPVALLPPLRFERMIAQLSTFTLHPKPLKGNTIPELLTDAKKLVRYIIPANAKPKLQRDLESLRITRRTLFPDLDGLSQSIVYSLDVVAYGPPTPPHWDENGHRVR